MTSPVISNHRLEFPALVDPITAPAIHTWLGGCEDAYEIFTMLTAKSATPGARILMAGLKMEGEGAVWWNENRVTLKALSSWDAFVARVKDRFVPSNWKLDALEVFYSVRQGDLEDFLTFAQRLQGARNVLSSAGINYQISDAVLKNHLLFYCNSRLRRRALAIPTFKFGETRVDGLIAMLSALWASMVEEGAVRRLPTGRAAISPVTPSTSPVMPRVALPPARPVTESERQHLKTVGGCFHCGLEPSSPRWYPHSSANCNGNPERGIAPRQTASSASRPSPNAAPAARVGAVLEADESDNIPYYTVGATHLVDDTPISGILYDEVPDDSDHSSDF